MKKRLEEILKELTTCKTLEEIEALGKELEEIEKKLLTK